MTTEAGKERSRRWKSANREKVNEAKRTYYRKNKEKINAASRAYYEKNREKILEHEKTRNLENREAFLARRKAYRLENIASYRAHQQRHKEENPYSWRLYGVRKSAKAKNVECDLDAEWFKERIEAGVCEMSGLPFDMGKKRGPSSPSVDRINPDGPYTKENCRLILWWINRALINLGDEYALNVFRAIFVRRGEMMPLDQCEAA